MSSVFSSATLHPSAVTFRSFSFCEPSFDDSGWRSLDLPHDFVVEGTFSKSADQAHGYLPFGVGWYRKHVDLPISTADAVFELTLDGVQVHFHNVVISLVQSFTPLAISLHHFISCST
jgi:hypothetical protein